MKNTLIGTTPTIENGRDRMVSWVWQVSEVTDDDGKVTRELAVLTSLHNAGRRCFSATLRRETETIEPGYGTMRGFMMYDGVHVAAEGVARYSARGLADFGARARAALLQRADDADVLAIFGCADVEEPPTCILVADQGDPDDCTTHDHEAQRAWTPPVSIISIGA